MNQSAKMIPIMAAVRSAGSKCMKNRSRGIAAGPARLIDMSAKKSSVVPADKLALYERLVATNPNVERKGDTNPYTSLNGHMFSHMTPKGILAIRLSDDDREAFMKKYKAKVLVAYGVVKKDWVVVPEALLKKTSELAKYFDRSYRYVKTLKPK